MMQITNPTLLIANELEKHLCVDTFVNFNSWTERGLITTIAIQDTTKGAVGQGLHARSR